MAGLIAKHTPGPWFAVGYQVEIESETVADICTTNAHLFGQGGLHDDARAMANARLIAAAPDMLKMLEVARDSLEVSNYEGEEDDVLAAIASVIARAKGEVK
jgi:hypothetical protein